MRNRMILAALLATLVAGAARGETPTLLSLIPVTPRIELPTGRYLFFPVPVDRILEPSGRKPLAGIYGGANFAMHSGQFTITEDGLTCCAFDDGTGIGIVVGAKAFIPITDAIDITPRVSFETRPGKFTTLGAPLPILGAGNQVETMQFEDQLNVSLAGLVLDPMASYTFTDFGLYATLGPSFSLVASKGFTKDETIANPNGVNYKTGGTAKRLLEGDLANIESLQIAGRGGVGARIPLTESIVLNPEALYTIPFTKVTTVDEWKTSGLQGTIGILFTL